MSGEKELVITSDQQWKQCLFNAAFRGLRWQGFQRVPGLLRSELPDGRRGCCAVGWAMPDDQVHRYTQPYERRLAKPLADYAAKGRFNRLEGFMWDLIGVHDLERVGSAPLETRLRDLAREHKLTIPDE